MRLFDIAAEFKTLQDILENDIEYNEETGEITDNTSIINQLFFELNVLLSDKLDNSAYIVKTLESTAATLKEEAKRLSSRAKSLENNAEKLKNIMSYALEQSEDKKLKTDKFTFSFRKSEVIEIDNILTAEDIDRKYVKIKREFDKIKIKDALKNGVKIEGINLVEKQNFQIK
jgi:hypothetical protein